MNAMHRLAAAAVLFAFAGTLHAASATRTSRFEYFAGSGVLSKEAIEPTSSNLCLVTTYDYDDFGNKIYVESRNCNGSANEAVAPTGDYVIAPRSTDTVWATATQARFPTSVTNAMGHTETRTYTSAQSLAFGVPTSLTGPNLLTTSWTYDSFGRKTLETRSDGNKTKFDYLFCSGVAGGTASCPTNGKYVVVTTPQNSAGTTNGAIAKTYHDMLGREIRSEVQGFDGTLVFKDTQYDANGRVSQVSRPYYNGGTPVWVVFTYDNLNRVLTETQPSVTGGQTRTTTAYNGLTTTVTVNNNGTTTNMPEGVSQTRTTLKNSQGQTESVTDTQGNTITYTYDPFGNLLTTLAKANAAAIGVTTTMGYDLRGRKTSMNDKDMGAWTYVIDPAGMLRRQTDAKSQVTTFAYDELDRRTARNEPSLNSTWTYDWCTTGVGKLCEVLSSNGYVRYPEYDTQGRLNFIYTELGAGNMFEVSYSYDANGRLLETTYPENNNWPPDVKVRNSYNARGYLASVTDAAGVAYWTANTVSASGKVLTATQRNGVVTTNAFDALDQMTSTSAVKSGVGTVQNHTYAYDAIGNMSQRVDVFQSNLTETVAYDRLNRVLQTSGAGLTTRSYTYDAHGNIATKSDAGTYTYPAVNGTRPHAVTSIAGTVNGFTNPSFTYDNNGSLLTGLGRTFTYTSFNQPNTVTGVRFSGGTSYTYTYTYSAEHERVRLVHSTLGTFFYLHPDGSGRLLHEKQITGTTTEYKNYVMAGAQPVAIIVNKNIAGVDQAQEIRYLHHDRLGSTTALSNASGAALERLAYDAFGDRRFPNGTNDPNNGLFGMNTDRGYTGHEHLDEIALIHMNGRLYDQNIGRFTSADPLIDKPDNLQDFNRYSYVNNNPFMYTDPTGYLKLKKLWRPLAAIAIAAFTGYFDFTAFAWGGANAGIFGGGAGLANSLAGGFAGGLVNSGGDFKAGLQGAFTAALFFGVGELGLGAGTIENTLAHAAVGCASAAASGGKCGSGALSAGFSEFAGPQLGDWGKPGNVIKSAVLGGTASVLGGGKFENGAVTAAFGHLFNEVMHSAGEARAKYGRGTVGHHWVPFGSTTGLDISSEARAFWGQLTNGISLPDAVHLPQHNAYNTAVRAELVEYARTNDIDLSKMTKDQARAFSEHIRASTHLDIARIVGRINTYQAMPGSSRALYRALSGVGATALAESFYPSPMRAPQCQVGPNTPGC